MQKPKPAVSLLLLFALGSSAVWAQSAKSGISVRAGYSATPVVIKQAKEPNNATYNGEYTNKVFFGDGPEAGLSKQIGARTFLDMGFAFFAGQGTKARIQTNWYRAEHFYALNGFQVPLTVSYLLRPADRKLQLSMGGGLQFLHGRLHQYEEQFHDTGYWQVMAADLKFTEIQLLARPGVQFRINKELSAQLYVQAAVSRRFSTHSFAGLNYRFR